MENRSNGEQFEKITAAVFRILVGDSRFVSVQRDVMLPGKDGNRQIDVLLTSDLGLLTTRTIIECRDIKRRIDVSHVDGLHSKLMDVDCNQAVLVTGLGYSKTAKKKADRVGIVLFTLQEALQSDWTFACPTPVCIEEIVTSSFRALTRMSGNDREISYRSFKKLRYKFNVEEFFRNHLLENGDAKTFASIDFDPTVFPIEPWFLDIGPFDDLYVWPPTKSRKCYRVEGLMTIRFAFKRTLYFAYLEDVIKISKVCLNNVLDKKERIFLKSEMIPGYHKKFKAYDSIDAMPAKPKTTITTIGLPVDKGRYHFRSRVPIEQNRHAALGMHQNVTFQ